MKKFAFRNNPLPQNPKFSSPCFIHTPSDLPLQSPHRSCGNRVRTGDQEERRRPPSPGYGALEIRGPATGRRCRGGGSETPPPEKHRGNRGEAARVSSTGPAKTTPSLSAAGKEEGLSDRPKSGQPPAGRVGRATNYQTERHEQRAPLPNQSEARRRKPGVARMKRALTAPREEGRPAKAGRGGGSRAHTLPPSSRPTGSSRGPSRERPPGEAGCLPGGSRLAPQTSVRYSNRRYSLQLCLCR